MFVVGASLAGLRAAESMRDEGFDGRLVVVGGEPHAPYNRPPLSKEVLAGAAELADTAFDTSSVDAEWRLGTHAAGLDVDAREISFDDGSRERFDGLVIATGATARMLPDADHHLPGVFTLRTLDDAAALSAALAAGPRVCVVGGGFIGCEVAATARWLGLEVTLVETQPLPLLAPLGWRVAELCAELQAAAGVRLRLGCAVAALEGHGRLERVRLGDGEAIDADVAVIGLGARPATGWLAGSGLRVADGVACDATLAVQGAERIVAAGDVARWPHLGFGGRSLRIEHWSNAVEQGMAAAARLVRGASEAGPFAPVPSFWSDQHGVKIQSLGLPGIADRCRVLEGSVAERRFVAAYGREGRLVGAVTFGMPKRLAGLRSKIARAAPFPDGEDAGVEAPRPFAMPGTSA